MTTESVDPGKILLRTSTLRVGIDPFDLPLLPVSKCRSCCWGQQQRFSHTEMRVYHYQIRCCCFFTLGNRLQLLTKAAGIKSAGIQTVIMVCGRPLLLPLGKRFLITLLCKTETSQAFYKTETSQALILKGGEGDVPRDVKLYRLTIVAIFQDHLYNIHHNNASDYMYTFFTNSCLNILVFYSTSFVSFRPPPPPFFFFFPLLLCLFVLSLWFSVMEQFSHIYLTDLFDC